MDIQSLIILVNENVIGANVFNEENIGDGGASSKSVIVRIIDFGIKLEIT